MDPDDWQSSALCRPHNTAIWYRADTAALAVAICQRCPARRPCYIHALVTGETHGIWGGIDLTRRSHGTEAIDNDDDWDGLLDAVALDFAEGPDLPETVCRRCGDPIKAGHHPRDLNGPAANCGLTATFNKGCRCRACGESKRASNHATRSATVTATPDLKEHDP